MTMTFFPFSDATLNAGPGATNFGTPVYSAASCCMLANCVLVGPPDAASAPGTAEPPDEHAVNAIRQPAAAAISHGVLHFFDVNNDM
ncbi:hypothetical protein [Microbacterium kribbense]